MTAAHQTDFYKTGHGPQYPDNTQSVYSNFTPRSSRLAPVLREYYDDKVVVFGIQALCMDFLINEFNEKFFKKSKQKAVKAYKRRMDTSLGGGVVSTDQVAALHDLGYLPLSIKAIPEGSRVNIKVPVLTVRETLPEFFWLVNYLETVMSCELWKPMTTATIAYEYRKILERYADETGAGREGIGIQCHDFSFRGMSGRHDAMMSGMGHLLSFVGTDTIPSIDAAEEFYFADCEKELIGCSVPATEHSVMCMGGKGDEVETFRRLIEDKYPTGIVSIVSDTWDFWKVITEYTVILKDKIMARQPNELGLNKVVFRPDSGNPADIICGLSEKSYRRTRDGVAYPLEAWNGAAFIGGCDPIPEHVIKGAVECLWDVFGGTKTEAGYKVLDEHVGLIYGDSITLERADDILKRLKRKGFASSNIVFGVGSYTYQYITRDSFGFAMKATHGVVDSEPREIFKDPVTDSGTKKSAKGLLRVEKIDDDYVLFDQQTEEQEKQGELVEVFRDSKMVKTYTFSEIRDTLLNN